ncbi:MAG: SpoIIE family protein phosphatase [Oscillospiraceae bacterium]|nr:SpoIIE family protein phosphatase [Oscillospiraceae bacterium]
MLQKVLTGAIGRIRPIEKARAAELALRFALSAATASLRLFGSFSPFGAAFAASADVGASGAVSLFGAAVGYALGGDVPMMVKYLAILALVRVAFIALRSTEAAESKWFPLAVTFVSFALVGFVYVFDGGFGVKAMALYLTECFVGAGSVLFYRTALSSYSEAGESRVSHLACLGYLAATALAGIAEPMLFGVLSVGRTLALVAVLLAVFKSGVGMGCIAATVLGAAMDLQAGTTGVFTMTYALAASLGGIFRKSGRLIFLLSFVCADAIGVVWSFGATHSAQPLFDAFAASVIFMLVPDHVLSKIGAVFPLRASNYGFSRARDYTSRRIGLSAEAFSILADTAGAVSGGDCADDPAGVYDRATETVCRGCKSELRCWQLDYADTYDILNHLTPKLTGEGRIVPGDFPDRLTERCGRIAWLASEINSEERALRLRRRFRAGLEENRVSAAGRYGDVAEVMRTLGRELSGGIRVEPALERRVVRALSAMSVDGAAAVFRLDRGRLRIEIKSESIAKLRRQEDWLEAISRSVDCRLREAESYDPTRLVLISAEPLRVSMGAAVQAKRGSRVSGDSFSGFETDSGAFCLIISDGMGTGEAAAKLSSAVVGSMKRFTCAGIAPELSLRLLEHAMFLRSEAGVETSTVDYLSLDTFSGSATLTKRGAPASYLKRGEIVKKLGSSLFPTGISAGEKSNSASFSITSGDEIVMITDGVTQGSGEDWLIESVRAHSGTPQQLADRILASAKRKTEFDDDMTVIVIKLEAQ